MNGFSNPLFKSFPSYSEAGDWLSQHRGEEVKEENARLKKLFPDTDDDDDENIDFFDESPGRESCPRYLSEDEVLVDYPNLDRFPAHLRNCGSEPAYIVSSPGADSLGSYEVVSYPPLPELSPSPERFLDPLVPLSVDQERVLSLVKEGNNVFFTGPAGSGKSLILQHIKRYLDTNNRSYAVTAPTGIAAVLIGGQTIHSWSKVGRGEKPVGYYIKKARQPGNGKSRDRKDSAWSATQVLIVDEISMVSLLQCLDRWRPSSLDG